MNDEFLIIFYKKNAICYSIKKICRQKYISRFYTLYALIWIRPNMYLIFFFTFNFNGQIFFKYYMSI